MSNILDAAKIIEKEIINHRRFLHQNAEVAFDLPVTTKYIKEQLTEMGYEPQEISRCGLVITAGGKIPGKTFLLRADTDGLPVAEQSDLLFKSTNGNMHACGHDFHASMLLGAAKILKDMEDELEGTVKLMFQPAEEAVSGAAEMIEAGVLNNPKVDAAMMIHVFSGFPLPNGTAMFLDAGPCFASTDAFEINIQGKGCHGAMPNQGIDPLVPLSAIHMAIHELNSREIAPGQFLVATTGKMSGGTTFNVIADSASMTGTIRTFDSDIRDMAKKRFVEIAEGIGAAYRCDIKVKFFNSCPSLLNDAALMESVKENTAKLLGIDKIGYGASFGMPRVPGSEDFSFISRNVPSTFVGLAAAAENDGKIYPMHHPKVKLDESQLVKGAAIYANSAIEWLKENK